MDKKFQISFISFLMGKSDIPQGNKILPCRNLSLKEALEIYRNNYYENLKKSLAQTYEACFILLTKDIFDKLASSFIKQHPFKQNVLAFYGEEFPSFLESSDTILASWPFLPQLAQLENTIKKLFIYSQDHAEMIVSHPIHQIWQSLLYKEEEEEIEELDGEKMLTIYKNDEEYIFFNLREKL